MAIRKPSVYDQSLFAFQDFLYHEGESEELRYILVKYDGEDFYKVKETFDTNPPNLKGGSPIARLDYTVSGQVVTIDHWEVYWRDEWPLRLAVQYLINCLYKQEFGYVIRVNKEAYPFWVSEYFFPATNHPNHYLVRNF